MNLCAHDIKLSFGKTQILKGVTLSVEGARLIGIIGPNGSGKSTLLRCLYRSLHPNEGAIYLDDTPLEDYPLKKSAQKIGVLPQQHRYAFDFTVLDMVLLGRSPHKRFGQSDSKEDIEIALQSLDAVDMGLFVQRQFNSLSGGEQQRVLLARALCQQTPCLILDEPTNHLDIHHQLKLMSFVKKSDKLVIAAIHDLTIAALFCDELVVMKEGKVIAQGTAEQVLTPDLLEQVYAVRGELVKDSKGYSRVIWDPQL